MIIAQLVITTLRPDEDDYEISVVGGAVVGGMWR
jgi:hypothetical protein